MAITQEQVKAIRQELNSLKPETCVASGNMELTVKQTIMALAPTLERMKKRGFELAEIAAKLHDKGIEIKPQTLAKYLAEARRQQSARKTKRQAASPHCSAPGTACRNAGPQAADTPPKNTDNSPARRLSTLLLRGAPCQNLRSRKNRKLSYLGIFKNGCKRPKAFQ